MQIEEYLRDAVDQNYKYAKQGRVATYIPELGHANPDQLGVSVITLDGRMASAGDYTALFTLQSISKVVALLLAMADHGKEEVFKLVGMEPTGDPFNSIVKLEMMNPSRPLNPMINAGAIAVTSLICGANNDEKVNRLLELTRKLCGSKNVTVNEKVFRSEHQSADRNRALVYFMRDSGILSGNAEDILEVYTRQCAIEVTCIQLAHMGAVLANEGRDLANGEQIVTAEHARIVKTFMVTCGMYNASGAFAIEVGIPAKSGVSGGILAVSPRQMGIGVIGPALDNKGNSIAGVHLLQNLSRQWNLSIF